MGRIWNTFQYVSKTISRSVLLHLAYFLGVGCTAITAKIFGKHFLNNYPSISTWQKRNHEQDVEKMY